jgi:hypothetical protein
VIHRLIQKKNLFSKIIKLTPRISDHLIIKIKINTEEGNKHFTKEHKMKRDYKSYNKEIFQEILNTQYMWNNSISDINVMANELTKSLEESLNMLCRCRKYTINEKHCHKAWFNLDIQNAMKQRHNLYKLAILSKSEESWNDYRTMRNNVVTMVRQAKNIYYQNLVENRKDQPKELWKKLKILLPGNTDQPSEASFEGTTYEDPTKISEKFNIYFIDSIIEYCRHLEM